MLQSVVLAVVCLAALTQSDILPDRVKLIICKKSEVNYSKCLRGSFEKAREFFMNGVPELDFPGIDPLVINVTSINSTRKRLVSITATMTNVRVTGMKDIIIDYISGNTKTLVGVIRLTIPSVHVSMEHDVLGQILVIPLRNRGFFKGDFSNIKIYMKAQFNRYKKNNVEYFGIKTYRTTFRVGNGGIKVTAKNPQLQFSADIMTNYYNLHPRLVMNTISPIFNDYSNRVIRQEIENYLAKVPAVEFLPE